MTRCGKNQAQVQVMNIFKCKAFLLLCLSGCVYLSIFLNLFLRICIREMYVQMSSNVVTIILRHSVCVQFSVEIGDITSHVPRPCSSGWVACLAAAGLRHVSNV